MAATKKKAGKKKAVRKKASRKKSVRKATAATTKKKAGRPKGSLNKKRGASLSGMSTTALAAELARRERRLPMLKRQQADLLRKLDEVEAQIDAIGGFGGGAKAGRKSSGRPAGRPVGSGVGRKRPRNAMNLEDALAKTLKGKTMSVTEVTSAVKAGGYKTTAANFRTIVNATLLKSKKIKKVSRGQYTAK